ncbi:MULTISPECIES: WXG100 family type VII secretion target [Anaerolinea]|uniref:Uncharacterized protein n=1 Tax=Anaerolinea thermophila (strain DSM 14523 / JCM 11388 / NBRC 100420 / UNI-1) TaxID=926569 RepID=E8MZS9_ANATU|nr:MULTISPECIES: hypothetical protein [Anaerolinea]BAJ64627.1 hypothetical protein ANT_26010 [Anaerolinea thermophila UNI-1]
MNIIHMETDLVYEQGKKMMYTASDFFNLVDHLQNAIEDLRQAWSSPRATTYLLEIEKIHKDLVNQVHVLDELSRRVRQEVDEWIETDRTQSAYLTALRESFEITSSDLDKVVAGAVLSSTLQWSVKRPNSIIFTGNNWMRKALGIKEMVRVIKPSTLARGMAIGGTIEALGSGISTSVESFLENGQQDISRGISAAVIDFNVKTILTGIGSVGIPVLLGGMVSVTGLPVIAGGAVIIGGSVLLGLAYSKFVEAPLWEMWKGSTLHEEAIESGKRAIDKISNAVSHLTSQFVQKTEKAFSNVIRGILDTTPVVCIPVTS